MAASLNKIRLKLSHGERRRALAYGIVGLFGLALGFIAMIRLGAGQIFLEPLSLHDKWMTASGGIGAMFAMYFCQDRLGKKGLMGWRQALVAFVWISFAGALFAGTLSLPLYGTMFGPFTLMVMFASAPLVGLLWLLNLMAAHMLMQTWQDERDSIFATG